MSEAKFKSELLTEIVQFWDNDAPEEVAALLDSVQLGNPECGYSFFNDDSAGEFITRNYGAEIRSLYDQSVLPAMRCDLFRYCYLAKHGGFYIDADYGSRISVADWVSRGHQGIFYERPKGICNSAIYVRDAEDPLMHLVLENALDNVRKRTSKSVWDMTGPAVFQRLYADAKTRPLFDNFWLVNEDEFKEHFELGETLNYKSTDAHWFVAKHKGIDPFKD